MSGNPLAFFEIAATLIPVLLLSGAVVERVRPDEGAGLAAGIGLGLVVVCAAVALAEILAIDAVVTGEWTRLTVSLVAETLALGIGTVIFVLVYPWFRAQSTLVIDRVLPGDLHIHVALSPATLAASAAVVVAAAAAAGGVVMFENVDRADELRHRGDLQKRITERANEVSAVENRVLGVTVAMARARRQVVVATAREEGAPVLAGFVAEYRTLARHHARERRVEEVLRARLRKLRAREALAAD
jgi:hypothetical protein